MKTQKTLSHILLVCLSLFLIRCNYSPDNQSTKTQGVVNRESTNEVPTDSEIENYNNELKTLYNELVSFKSRKDFLETGFQQGSVYSEWIKKVEDLKSNPISRILNRNGVVVGELQGIGFEYLRSKGKETPATKTFRISFESYFNQLKNRIENEEKSNNYQSKLGDLFGEWKITNTMVNQSYNYKIYESNGNYIGLRNNDTTKPEILNRRGTKFTISGNRFGEYYIINSNKEMTLYDQDGDLKRTGYIAILKK